MSVAFPLPGAIVVRRRSTRSWRRPVVSFGRPRFDDTEPAGGPVVTLTVDPGCDPGPLAAGIGRLLGAPVLDDDIPVLVAAELGIPEADARTLDGTAPSPLLQAVLWSGFTNPAPELIGAVAAVDLVTRCFHQTEDVIRSAARTPTGAVVVGRGAAFVLAGHPAAFHVRVTAPAAWRRDRVAARLDLDPAAAGAWLARADRAATRAARHGYRVDLADASRYDLVLDLDREETDSAAAFVAAAARQRHATPAPGAGRSD